MWSNICEEFYADVVVPGNLDSRSQTPEIGPTALVDEDDLDRRFPQLLCETPISRDNSDDEFDVWAVREET